MAQATTAMVKIPTESPQPAPDRTARHEGRSKKAVGTRACYYVEMGEGCCAAAGKRWVARRPA
jgi:hypothetical protein